MINYHFQVSNVCRKVSSQTEDGLVVPYISALFIVTKSQYYPLKFWFHHIPSFWIVAYGKHSLTHLGPVIQAKLDKFTRSFESLVIINFLKVRQNSFSKPCWSVLVKTLFYVILTLDLYCLFYAFLSTYSTHLHTSYRFNINFVRWLIAIIIVVRCPQ